MNFCSTCGAKANSNAFCTQCGTSLKQESGVLPVQLSGGVIAKAVPDTFSTPVYTAVPVTETSPLGPPVAVPAKADTVKGISGPGMCLVKKGDKHQIRLKFASNLKSGESVPALLGGVHDGMAIGRRFLKEKIFGEWRVTQVRECHEGSSSRHQFANKDENKKHVLTNFPWVVCPGTWCRCSSEA